MDGAPGEPNQQQDAAKMWRKKADAERNKETNEWIRI
jgi:hypothetical protein